VRLISLQKGATPEELADFNGPLTIVESEPGFDDANGPFMDTAAIMTSLDLVISSDTSISHLAGALGMPVWLLTSYLPCWRWQLNRSDSPWYPTMRIFRQRKSGDWDSVLAEVKAALTVNS
jgi:ADP-heptose:LPS heptosyltransferase